VFIVADGSLPVLVNVAGAAGFSYEGSNGMYLHVRKCLPQEL